MLYVRVRTVENYYFCALNERINLPIEAGGTDRRGFLFYLFNEIIHFKDV
jgi:hypothetical protein